MDGICGHGDGRQRDEAGLAEEVIAGPDLVETGRLGFLGALDEGADAAGDAHADAEARAGHCGHRGAARSLVVVSFVSCAAVIVLAQAATWGWTRWA